MAQEIVWQLPFASSVIEEGPTITGLPGTVSIRFADEDGQEVAIQFGQALSFSFVGFELCTDDMLDAYDKVIQLHKSKLLRKIGRLKRALPSGLHHYRMFLDDIGCYDVVAATFEHNC